MSVFVSVYLCLSICVCLSMFICVCVCLSVTVYLSLSLSVYPCLSIFVYLCLSVCVTLNSSIYLCLSVSVYLCSSKFFCLFVSVRVCLSVFVYLCLSLFVCLCPYIRVCLSLFLCVYLSVSVCLCLYQCQFLLFRFEQLSSKYTQCRVNRCSSIQTLRSACSIDRKFHMLRFDPCKGSLRDALYKCLITLQFCMSLFVYVHAWLQSACVSESLFMSHCTSVFVSLFLFVSRLLSNCKFYSADNQWPSADLWDWIDPAGIERVGLTKSHVNVITGSIIS